MSQSEPQTSPNNIAVTPREEMEKARRQMVLASLSLIRKETTATMKDISQIADRSSSNLLLTLGALALTISFVFKIHFFRTHIASLSSGEFVAALVIALVLLLVGAALRLYQTKKEQEAGKRIRESGLELLSKSMDTGDG